MKLIRVGFAGIMLAGALATAASAQSFKAEARGMQEVPPTMSGGVGTFNGTYDPRTRVLTWTGSVSALTGPATAAHLHGPASPGQNAGVLVPIPGVKIGPFEGSARLSAAQARALMGGQTYFNVHTAANSNGEIRGQVTAAK